MGKYTVGDFLAELILSKMDSDLKFVFEDEYGNRTDIDFIDNEHVGETRVFVFREKE